MILRPASNNSPLYCEFSERKNPVLRFASNSLSRFANSSHACPRRGRRSTEVGWDFFQAQACIGGGNTQRHSGEATRRGAKSVVLKRFSGEEERDSGSLSSASARNGGNYDSSNFGQDPIVNKLRNQLGGIQPIPSPPIDRNFHVLLAFFFFVGVVFDKVWTYRTTNARDEYGQPNSLPLVHTSLSTFLEKDLQRKETVEWVNMVLGKLWKVYSDEIEKWIVGLLQPVIDNLKRPDILQRVEIKQFSLGDEAISVRSVERRTSRSVNDLQYQIGLRYAGGARMLLHLTLKFGIIPIIVPVGIRNLDVDGELWVDLRLIPKEPYVGSVSWAFVSLPKIKFDLSAFRLFNIMAIPILSTFLTKLLTKDLPKLFVRPKKIVIDFQKPQGVGTEIKTGEVFEGDKNYAGELSVTLLDARKLPYTLYGKTDPYVVLKLGDQVIHSKQNSKTSVTGPPGKPMWNQDFYMLVSDPAKEKLCVEVKDSLGFTYLTLGKAELDLGSLPDTVPTVRIVQLRGSWWRLFRNDGAGEILLRLTYKACIEEDEEDKDKPKKVHADTEEPYKESLVDDLTALLTSEEFQGIRKSEDDNTETLYDRTDANIESNQQISANSRGSALFWLVLVTSIAVLVATNMGGSNWFHH